MEGESGGIEIGREVKNEETGEKGKTGKGANERGSKEKEGEGRKIQVKMQADKSCKGKLFQYPLTF